MAILGTALATLAGAVACSPAVSIQTLEVRPSGTYGQVLTFTAAAPAAAAEHVVYVGVDVDPAKLMGWAKGNRPYTTSLAAKLTGPDGTAKHATLYLPITEQQEVGREGNTVQVAFLPAGKMLDTGFRRGELKEAFRFSPRPGTWTLTIEMRTANNADQMMIKAIRTLRLDVRTTAEAAEALAPWTVVP